MAEFTIHPRWYSMGRSTFIAKVKMKSLHAAQTSALNFIGRLASGQGRPR